ncbi:DNA polymerase delta subunit 2, partial [Physocladia obscura]
QTNYTPGSIAKKASSTNSEIYHPQALPTVDNHILTPLCAAIPHVDLMPGELDPSNYALPQRPMPSGLFPIARGFSSFNQVSNPYAVNVPLTDDDSNVNAGYDNDGNDDDNAYRLFLGSSGQNFDDVVKYSLSNGVFGVADRLDVAQRLLSWGHLAPTAPDTLGINIDK